MPGGSVALRIPRYGVFFCHPMRTVDPLEVLYKQTFLYDYRPMLPLKLNKTRFISIYGVFSVFPWACRNDMC